MDRCSGWNEPTVTLQVFPAYSIEIPTSFAETFVHDDGYWHAYDADRSVSLTSLTLTDGRRRPSAAEILDRMPPLEGTPVRELPSHFSGAAATADATQPARASRVLSGVLAAEGRLLIVTITSDDLDWARRVWLSIRMTPPA